MSQTLKITLEDDAPDGAAGPLAVGEHDRWNDLKDCADEAEVTTLDPSKACLVTVSFKNATTSTQHVSLFTPEGALGSSEELKAGDEVEFSKLLPAGRTYAFKSGAADITGVTEQPIG